ncbi:UV excision repair RAD23-like protein [Trypanosoma theileri]|uniref:UV excision repair protein RAD23 n=1 Tax=Trypanosoma theileri TaxID=67003 RepID=A0A1X0P199_9TRYP|nr:UV excision repair RAD23-like protein [Trypanosoma theileri]ORC90726.1 UV excision repair RAD23-like protein [Trypanosoma theileri]
MKVILKTLGGKEHIQEVSPQTKVEEIKQTLSAEYVTEGLRLCCNGAVIDNAKTVEELGLQENAVIIIAGKKRKVQESEKAPNSVNSQPTEKASSAKSEETNEGKPTGEQQKTETSSNTVAPVTNTATTTAAPATTGEAQGTTTTTSSSFPASFHGTDTRGIDPALIDSIVAMGFEDRGQVALALRTAYMNPDRAVEFLCTGIPSRAIEQIAEEMNVPTTQPGHSAELPNRRAPLGGQPQGNSNLRQALMNIPDFEEIRALVQTNPQALAAVLQQLQLHYPEIIELIQQSPDEFGAIMMGGGPQGAGGVLPSAGPPLGEEEQAAVQRLVSLGGGTWTEHDAIVAYRACEQNEEAAAQLLLDSFSGNN